MYIIQFFLTLNFLFFNLLHGQTFSRSTRHAISTTTKKPITRVRKKTLSWISRHLTQVFASAPLVDTRQPVCVGRLALCIYRRFEDQRHHFSGRPVVALWRKQEQGGAAIRIVPTGEWQLWNDKNSIQKHKIKVNKNRKLLYIPCVWIVQEQACKNKQRFSFFCVFFTVFAEQAKLRDMYLRRFTTKTQSYNYQHITFKTNVKIVTYNILSLSEVILFIYFCKRAQKWAVLTAQAIN